MPLKKEIIDTIIIGAGQSALACAYYLRRTKLHYLLLDNQERCGGAWLHTWDSLTLFSPAEANSLPGRLFPKSGDDFPDKKAVIQYLCDYEKRYEIPVERPVQVEKVDKKDGFFLLQTNKGEYRSRSLISATGTQSNPFVPDIPGRARFQGHQIHSSQYRRPDPFFGKKVVIVGEGNSGAQLLAEVSKVADTRWATANPPDFLPDEVDGRVLFNQASAKYYAEQKGDTSDRSKLSLGHIVMVPSVKEARERGVLRSDGQIAQITEQGVVWKSGRQEAVDAIIWCTGFHYATQHLKNLVSLDERGRTPTKGTRSTGVEGLWLVGYGGWTGYASATLIGVGRSARQTVKEVDYYLRQG